MTRFTIPAAVFLLLIKDDKVLLLRRKNTSWSDGDYDLIAGHIDGNEKLTDALLREAREEIGITFDPDKARFVHIAHFLGDKEYLYTTFEVKKWDGEPQNLEPEKHDDLRWFALSNLPANITIGSKTILDSYKNGNHYSEISG